MTVRSDLSPEMPDQVADVGVEGVAPDECQVGRSVIAELHRIVTPNGVNEAFEVSLGGTRQAVSVRGSDRGNPLLLVMHGGPGVSAVPTAWTYQRPWEDFFTVVHWDQRGAGRSFALNEPAEIAPTLSLDRYRDDAIELIALLCERYGQEKVVAMGLSWGSAIGLSVAESRPDLLHAYVGVGQIIAFRLAESLNLQATLATARRLGHTHAIGELESLGSYPGDGPFDPGRAMLLRKWNIYFGTVAFNRDSLAFWMQSEVLSPSYGAADLKTCQEAVAFSTREMAAGLIDLDFRSVKHLDVPVILLHGEHDAFCPIILVEDWVEVLEAPAKRLVRFRHSAHVPPIEQPGTFFKALVDLVLPACTAPTCDHDTDSSR